MMDGIIVVKKEKGFTSFDVVAKMRGICRQKKIGHTGTLDPDAEGVLPVCLGKATKVCDMLTDSDKEYEAMMLLGVETDTQDTTGTILREADTSALTEAKVLSVIRSFEGEQKQIPPMYSALKVDGKKLCDLARAGITVERKAREITVYSIEILCVQLPRVTVRIRCSKGTYIRTICHDIGQRLGCGAAMEKLTRTRAAGYGLEQAHTLSEIEQLRDGGGIDQILHPIEEVFAQYPALYVTEQAHPMLRNGNGLHAQLFTEVRPEHYTSPVRVYDKDGVFSAIYNYHEEKQLFKPEKMFLQEK